MENKNPAAQGRAHRVLKVKALSSSIDTQNPIETLSEIQPEMLAVKSVMRRFGIGYHHAQVVCRHAGLGGAA